MITRELGVAAHLLDEPPGVLAQDERFESVAKRSSTLKRMSRIAWTITTEAMAADSATHRRHRNDVTQLIPLLDKVPPVRGRVGRPRRRPDCVIADRGYDHDKHRRLVRERRIRPLIARRQTEHGPGLGRVRWVVERTFAWLHHFKRLLVRHDRRAAIPEAFLAIGCCLVCFRRLAR